MKKQIYNLLDKKNRTLCSMLDLLTISREYTPTSVISNYLNLNNRSIQRYIHELEGIILQFNTEKNSDIQLSYTKFQGVKINFLDYSPEVLKQYLLEQDLTINIFLDLIYERMNSIQYYAQIHYLPETLVRNSLQRISDFTFNFDVKVNNRSVSFEGTELNIRLCIFIFLWNLYNTAPWPFKFISEDDIYRSVQDFSIETNVTFSPINVIQFSYLIAINNLRVRKHHPIEIENRWDKYVSLKKVRDHNFFKTGVQSYITSSTGELYFYLLIIQMKIKFYESEDLRNRIYKYHKKTDSDILRLTNICITEFENYFFNIPNYNKEFAYYYIFSSLIYSKIFMNIKVDIEGTSFSAPPYYHQNIIIKIEDFLNHLYKLTNDSIFLNKEFLLLKYYMLVSFFQNIIDYEEEISILISSDLPLLTRESMKKELHKRFSSHFNILFLDIINNDSKPDLVLTNFKFLYLNENICPIDYPITEYNIKVIESKLMEIIDQKYKNRKI